MEMLIKLKKKAKEIVAKRLIIAKRLEDESLIKFRRFKCRGDENTPACPFYVKDKKGIEVDECSVCTCIIENKTETEIENTAAGGLRRTHCPMGYWLDKQLANFYREQEGKELLI